VVTALETCSTKGIDWRCAMDVESGKQSTKNCNWCWWRFEPRKFL